MQELFKNSYVILAISFVTLCIVFYLGEFGYTVQMVDGRPMKKFSWKYPLAISLIIWVVWHFYVYPLPDEIEGVNGQVVEPHTSPKPTNIMPAYSPQGMVQNINMTNWT